MQPIKPRYLGDPHPSAQTAFDKEKRADSKSVEEPEPYEMTAGGGIGDGDLNDILNDTKMSSKSKSKSRGLTINTGDPTRMVVKGSTPKWSDKGVIGDEFKWGDVSSTEKGGLSTPKSPHHLKNDAQRGGKPQTFEDFLRKKDNQYSKW